MPNIRILIVDDSSPIRQTISSLLTEEDDMQVVGIAPNGRMGVEKVTQVRPDVVLLDIEMPEMDGMTALKLIRKDHANLPIIMFSALTKKGATQTLEALALGADDYVAKPSMQANLDEALENCKNELVPKIRALCGRAAADKTLAARVQPANPARLSSHADVVVLTASTGGPNALAELLPRFPANCPVPIIVVQSMLPLLVKSFVEKLQGQCRMKVLESGAAQPLLPGIYVATGQKHTVVERVGNEIHIVAKESVADNQHVPSTDILLQSLTNAYGGNCLVGVLTGMGNNGVKGCELVRSLGGEILVQDQASSKVWGTASAVLEAGVAHGVLPLNGFYDHIRRRILASKSSPVLAAS
ncbi:MAG: chemotaxis-specific protein-glutamate methyltransferase CheB [Acidobacteriia bacterium]|nr:chemotaxis-specific protein-glutamate methyltransferase CheB [Terriglobia bacterium]